MAQMGTRRRGWFLAASAIAGLSVAFLFLAPSLARRMFIEMPLSESSPPNRVVDLTGNVVNLAASPGVLFVDVTALGCAGCTKDKRDIAALAERYSDRIKFAVVIYGQTGTALQEAARRLGIEHLPVYGYPPTEDVPPFVRGFPTKLLLKDGKTVARELGSTGFTERLWRPLLAAAAHGTPNSALQPPGAPVSN